MISRITAVASKEIMHIRRDPFTLGLAIGLPVVLVIFFGFAINFDFRNIKLAWYDYDNTRQSREVAAAFLSSGYFSLFQGKYQGSPEKDVESGSVFASVVIPAGFAKTIVSGGPVEVQILADGSDNQKAGVISGYIGGIQQSLAYIGEHPSLPDPIRLMSRFLFNPELNSRWFIVPGLIVVVVGLLAILMTALTVAREWENGSMELLLSTPVTPIEIIIGKMLPYIAIVLVSIIFVYSVSQAVFKIPFRGSQLLFWGTCLLYIITSLAVGLLISVTTRHQQKAMQVALVTGFLPSLLLSGFIFPIESMPLFFRYLTMLLPPRWFIVIVRTLYLKGAPPYELAAPLLMLTGLSIVILFIASKKFKKDLEP